jgi:hypothetical protein
MTTFPNSPRILKGGIVLMDAQSSKVLTVISLQYNPESLTRSLQVQGFGGENSEHSEALRLKGPAIETIKLEADIDATDQLEFPDQNQDAVQYGVQPQLATIEALINPTSQQLQSNNNLANAGTLEIAPMESPLSLFVWSQHRIVPIRVTEFSITEEAFDVALNPIRAKVNLGFRVLSVSDLGFDHKGGHVFMSYLQNKERLASKISGVGLNTFGIGGIP